jgi:pimeloyl-ACP methyl ester carboxylesterase
MRAFHLTQPDAFIRYDDLPGAEPARVFLAGLGCGATSAFAPVVTDPAFGGRRSLLVDCLGFGKSDRPFDFTYSLGAHADSIVELLDGLALDTYELIGHSFGGSVAVHIAAERPERVASLVLADANLDPGGGAFSTGIAGQLEQAYIEQGHDAALARLQQAATADPSPTGEAMLNCLQVADPCALHRSASSLVAMPPPTVREQLLQLRMPRAMLFGDRTLQSEVASGKIDDWPYVADLRAAGVRIGIVPTAGHGMVWDNPIGFARLAAEVLREAPG